MGKRCSTRSKYNTMERREVIMQMGKLGCPVCKSDLLYEGSDIEGNSYFYCDKPHNWFQRFLDWIGLWKGGK